MHKSIINKIQWLMLLCIVLITAGCGTHTRSISTYILDETPAGTPPRVEREFKLSLNTKESFAHEPEVIMSAVSHALSELIEQKMLSVEKITKKSYYIDDAAKAFVFRDTYYDNEESDLAKKDMSYRLRYRFNDVEKYDKHERYPEDPAFFPDRAEIQAKTDRQEVGNGFSTVKEARFEFRNASEPFSKKNKAPRSPWTYTQFSRYPETGRFQKYTMWPTYHMVESLEQVVGRSGSIHLRPETVLLTRRDRIHLNMKTPWGSGPNPEQVFIISLDTVDVYDKTYHEYVIGKKEKPEKIGSYTEMEIEFERNVSTRLDQLIEKGNEKKRNKAYKAHKAFLKDQKNIVQHIESELMQLGIEIEAASQSKYSQAVQILSNNSM